MTDSDLCEHLVGRDVNERDRAVELIADPELIRVCGVYGDRRNLRVLRNARRGKEHAGAEGVKQANCDCWSHK